MSQLNRKNARARERGREGGKKDSISGGAAETDRGRAGMQYCHRCH